MSDTDHTSDLTSEGWRMNAYYYGFDRTGQVVIDRILSAVAHAGKGYHHTEFWTDHLDYGAPSHLRGDSYAECIQNAAIDAADTLRIAEARATAAEVAAATSGDQSTAVTSGYQSTAKVEGEHSIAVAGGHQCRAMGSLGYWLVLAELDDDGAITHLESVQVDGERIKPDVAYMLRDGQVVEA